MLDEGAEFRFILSYGEFVLEVHVPVDGGFSFIHHGGLTLDEVHALSDGGRILVEVPAGFESVDGSHAFHHAGDVADV